MVIRSEKPVAVIVGASSDIGKALCTHLRTDYVVIGISRSYRACQNVPYHQIMQSDYSESSIDSIVAHFQKVDMKISLMISCLGILHAGQLDNSKPEMDALPEKSLRALASAPMQASFQINAILPMLFLSRFAALLPRKAPCRLVFLSAMVGSISDNRLGGWYSYRSSKAALNMLVKTASIELGRSHPNSCVVSMHPGTTRSSLSRPFLAGIDQDNLQSPELAAVRIVETVSGLTPAQSGSFLDRTGKIIAW
jgi:NAD(P)-dependent dehydrogenase (short-subunit alcohol dehydrogenase family)